MTSEWDQLANNKFIPTTSKSGRKEAWGTARPINVYDNLITRHLDLNGEKIAFVAYQRNKKITYSYNEINTLTRRLASLLANYVGNQDRILVIGPPCITTTLSILASSFIGCEHTVVMTSIAANAIEEIIELFKPKVVVTCNTKKHKMNHGIANISLEVKDKIIIHDSPKAGTEAKNAPYTYQPKDYLFSLFTSGTTGSPKQITHGAFGYLLFAAYTIEYFFNFKSNSTILCGSEAGWINGHTYSIYGPLLNGGTSILIETPSRLSSVDRLTRIASETELTILYLPVTTIRLLKAVASASTQNTFDTSKLKIESIGSMGEMLAPTIENWYSKYFSKDTIPVVNTYFQTETGGILCAKRWDSEPGITEGQIGEIPWYLDISSDKKGQLYLEKNIPGLMVNVKSNSKNDEELRRYYFDEDKGYRLHDYGKIINNNLYVSGRSDDVMKIRGIRIASGQIEAVALESPLVVECAAVEAKGRLDVTEITLYITTPQSDSRESRAEINPKQLLLTINEDLCAKVGEHISISKLIILKKLPKTQSGKIKRSELRNRS